MKTCGSVPAFGLEQLAQGDELLLYMLGHTEATDAFSHEALLAVFIRIRRGGDHSGHRKNGFEREFGSAQGAYLGC